jgi:2-oxoglutarate ferredoxin oxidoreductase subunit alpha
MLQARWGSHGDYELIALAPNSVQECLDLTREAFALAERFRTPVLIMTDGEVGHMREKIVLPSAAECPVQERSAPCVERSAYVPFAAVRGEVPEMADFGTGYHTYVTGLTHNERGFPATDDPDAHAQLVTRICAKITNAGQELTRVELDVEAGAEVGIVSYGISARAASGAVTLLRSAGSRVSHLRLIGIYPFPELVVQEFAQDHKRLIVPEMNLGQICHTVREAVAGAAEVERVSKIGGEIIQPPEIAKAVKDGGIPV